ncbi:MAG TPA: nitroreductase, partial [Ignavibacteria bacterium]|nr:nitroreductase [Ignavibacteria bacterium]
IGMGMQFVSTPGEFPDKWNQISRLLHIPENYEMAAIFRMGYKEKDEKRRTIDWRSEQRKPPEELAFKNKWNEPLK